MKGIRKHLLQISPAEAKFSRRGFCAGNKSKQDLLEHIGSCFIEGFNRAIEKGYSPWLFSHLESVETRFRGFEYEGAAMGLKLLDRLSPGKKDRFGAFASGEGEPHIYMVHVGAGWALARLPWRFRRSLHDMHPLLRWLAVDGYGFHEGYFHWRQSIVQRRVPWRLRGYERRAFDQGLGRSLWFVQGADVERVTETVLYFPESRQADLWSGLGLASAYAGGVDSGELQDLAAASGPYRSWLAQGAAFAAKARLRAGNAVNCTERACLELCGISANQAATITDIALQGLQNRALADDEGAAASSGTARARSESTPAYEIWRRRVRESFCNEAVLA